MLLSFDSDKILVSCIGSPFFGGGLVYPEVLSCPPCGDPLPEAVLKSLQDT